MNKRKCDYCGNEYDKSLKNCPFCTVENDSVENNESIITKSSIITKESIIFDSKSVIDEMDEDDRINIIKNRNTSLKKNKRKNNQLYSYLLLLMAMILLFIIIFSCIQGFILLPFIHYIFTVISLFIAFNLSYRNIEAGYFIGLISSIAMILMVYEGDYISAIIGIYIFASSFRYLIKK